MDELKRELMRLLHHAPCRPEMEGEPGSCPYRRDGRCREINKLDICAMGVLVDLLIDNNMLPQRWIPVAERLPDEHESIFVKFQFTDNWMPGMFLTTSNDVIAAVICKDGSRKTAVARTQDGKWNMRYIPSGKEITHWMPLPEPPAIPEVRE